jgi:hypothetical protein
MSTSSKKNECKTTDCMWQSYLMDRVSSPVLPKRSNPYLRLKQDSLTTNTRRSTQPHADKTQRMYKAQERDMPNNTHRKARMYTSTKDQRPVTGHVLSREKPMNKSENVSRTARMNYSSRAKPVRQHYQGDDNSSSESESDSDSESESESESESDSESESESEIESDNDNDNDNDSDSDSVSDMLRRTSHISLKR